MINKNDYLWIDFADRYRSLASHAVDFMPRDFMQYTIVLDDGSELIYDTEYKVVRNILKDNDCMDDVLMRREFAWRLKKQMHRAEIRQEELSEREYIKLGEILLIWAQEKKDWKFLNSVFKLGDLLFSCGGGAQLLLKAEKVLEEWK